MTDQDISAALKAVINQSEGCGNLHFVIEDLNIEDHWLEDCLESANLTDAERRCCKALLSIAESERIEAIRRADTQ